MCLKNFLESDDNVLGLAFLYVGHGSSTLAIIEVWGL